MAEAVSKQRVPPEGTEERKQHSDKPCLDHEEGEGNIRIPSHPGPHDLTLVTSTPVGGRLFLPRKLT